MDFQQAVELFSAGRLPEAAAVCRGLLDVQPQHVQALHMLSLILANEGQTAEALEGIERVIQLEPQSLALRAAKASMLLYAERLDEAEAVVQAGLAAQPQAPDLLDLLGVIRLGRGDPRSAEECFRSALKLSPGHAGARGNLALLYEQSNRMEEVLCLTQEGLAARPGDVTLRLVLGRCQRRQGDYAAARNTLTALQQAGTPKLRRDVEYELALCADALEETEAAFEHSRHANALARELKPQSVIEGQGFGDLVQNLYARFTPEWVAAWQDLPADSSAQPMFLVGFPRSGTTLLDSMLGAHPDVMVLEERPTVQAMLDGLVHLPGGYPEALKDLTEAERAALARDYSRVATAHARDRKCALDKSPFLSVHAGLIQRVFPGAPILFMVRHPCDVVWSCFMTNMELNPGTVHFTELPSTVNLYCGIMALWLRYRDLLPLNYRLVRYEDLLDAPGEVLRDILAFLGLPWSENVLRHTEHVAVRGRISSASYAQVSRPLYHSARDRWRRYVKYLEPYFPQLRPYCELFGYAL
ncbi:MAG: sulfotransferase [Gammaproteobacteria bacterium]